MALTTEEQELLDFALGALPPWFSDAESRDLAVEAGMAKMVGAARAQIAYWFGQALISDAVGATATTPDWLQQHAIDRGTRRQNSESDPALRLRLRLYPDALTRAAILSIAQDVIDDAGVTGTVVMLELRRDRAFLGKNAPQTGTGGTFVAEAGNLHGFQPTAGWSGGRPPFRGAGIEPPITYKLVISSAGDAANNGTFTISSLDGDRAVYTNASGVAGADATVAWRVDRYDRDGNLLTAGTGRQDAYLSRGHRMGAQYSTILLILPYGTTAATAAGVAEAVRQRKAAGVRVLVERRLNP